MKIAKYWKKNSMKERKKSSKLKKKKTKKTEIECRREEILMKSTSSRKLVKFVNLNENEVTWSSILKKASYEEILQFKEQEIANDEFDFERCESKYLSLKRSNRKKESSMKIEKNKKKTLIESRLNNDWKIKTLTNVQSDLARHVISEKTKLKTLTKSRLNNDWKNKTLIKKWTNLTQHVILKKIKSKFDKKSKKRKTLIESELNNDWKIKTLIKIQSELALSRDSEKNENKKQKKMKQKKWYVWILWRQ